MPRKMLSVPSVATIDGTLRTVTMHAVDHAEAEADDRCPITIAAGRVEQVALER